MLNDLLKESNFAELIYDIARDEGIEQGIEQGRAAGIEQGEAKGMREAIIAVLLARFGTLDERMIAAIEQREMPALKELLPHCATEPLERIRTLLDIA